MKRCCCYNCKYLKDKGVWYKEFVCELDGDVLDEFNLKLAICSAYEEKIVDSNKN